MNTLARDSACSVQAEEIACICSQWLDSNHCQLQAIDSGLLSCTPAGFPSQTHPSELDRCYIYELHRVVAAVCCMMNDCVKELLRLHRGIGHLGSLEHPAKVRFECNDVVFQQCARKSKVLQLQSIERTAVEGA